MHIYLKLISMSKKIPWHKMAIPWSLQLLQGNSHDLINKNFYFLETYSPWQILQGMVKKFSYLIHNIYINCTLLCTDINCTEKNIFTPILKQRDFPGVMKHA